MKSNNIYEKIQPGLLLETPAGKFSGKKAADLCENIRIKTGVLIKYIHKYA